MSSDFESTAWTCPDCGIMHSQQERVDLLSKYDVPEGWLKGMEWNRYCNCGVWELYADAVLRASVPMSADDLKAIDTDVKRRAIPRNIRAQIVP